MVDRNGNAISSGVIPLDLEHATLKMAVKLATSEITVDNDAAVQGIERVKAGPVEVEFKDEIDPFQDHPADRYSYESVLPNDVLALLVPSWLCPKRAQRWFEVL